MRPPLSWRLTSAPLARSISTISDASRPTALCSGVLFEAPRALMSMLPSSSRSSTVPRSPEKKSRDKGQKKRNRRDTATPQQRLETQSPQKTRKLSPKQYKRKRNGKHALKKTKNITAKWRVTIRKQKKTRWHTFVASFVEGSVFGHPGEV